MNKKNVKIAIFSSSDKQGGAASCCYQFMHFLRDGGYDAIEVVIEKTCNDPFVVVVPPIPSKKKTYLQRIKRRLVRLVMPPMPKKRDISEFTSFEYCFFPYDSDDCVAFPGDWIAESLPFVPNIVFVGHSYALLNSTSIVELKQIWRCHFYMMAVDVGAYTGGCHVHWDCRGYIDGCVNCPAVNTIEAKERISTTFETKLKNYRLAKVGITYSSLWQEQDVMQSALFKNLPHFKMSPLINLDVFSTKHRKIAKQLFNFPRDCSVILFAAQHLDEKRKGYEYFVESVRILWQRLTKTEKKDLYFMFAGNFPNRDTLADDLSTSLNVVFVPFTNDLRYLSLIYQAADVFVCPTLEDAGPMMVLESLACGTPVVGFKTGYICDPDLIKNGITGYACEMRNSCMLADGMQRFISMSNEQRERIAECCSDVVQMCRKDVKIKEIDDFVTQLLHEMV